MSNIVPKKDTCETFTNKAERKNTKIIPPPPNKNTDLGKFIFPSKNLAKPQKMTERTNPTTKSAPLEITTGILVKGKKKNGNNVTIKKSDKTDSLSNIFERIGLLYYNSAKKCNSKKLQNDVDKSVFDINNFFDAFALNMPSHNFIF